MSHHRKRPERSLTGKHASSLSMVDGLWIYGIHPVSYALSNPRRKIHRLLSTEKHIHGIHPPPGIEPEIVTRHDIDALVGDHAVHQGIAALVDPLPRLGLNDYLDQAPQQTVLIILDHVTDPHNVGAIMRSAAAFGASGLLMTDEHSPKETGVLAKSASGALEKTPLIHVTNLVRAMDILKNHDFWMIGLDESGDASIGQVRQTYGQGRVALVLGAEGQGLRRLTKETCDLLLRIPTHDDFSTLNVSNAAAILLYALNNGMNI